MNDGWMEHLKTRLILNESLLWLSMELGCTGIPGGGGGSWYPITSQPYTHIGSLGSLGSFQPLVTWVALKCKGERPWLV